MKFVVHLIYDVAQESDALAIQREILDSINKGLEQMSGALLIKETEMEAPPTWTQN